MISSRRRLALVTLLLALTVWFATGLSAGTMAPDAPQPIRVLKGHTRDLANAAFAHLPSRNRWTPSAIAAA